MGPPAFGPLVGWIGAEQYGRVRVPQIERYPFRAYAHAPLAWFHAAAARAHRDPGSDRPVRHRRPRRAPAGARRGDLLGEMRCQPPRQAERSRPREGVLADGSQMYAVADGHRRELARVLRRPLPIRATPGIGSAMSPVEAPFRATERHTCTRHPRCSRSPRSPSGTRNATTYRCGQRPSTSADRVARLAKGDPVLTVAKVTDGSSYYRDLRRRSVSGNAGPHHHGQRDQRHVPLRRRLCVRRGDIADHDGANSVNRPRALADPTPTRSRPHHRPASRVSTSATGRARSTGPRSARRARSSPTSRRPSTPASSTTSTRRIDPAPSQRA